MVVTYRNRRGSAAGVVATDAAGNSQQGDFYETVTQLQNIEVLEIGIRETVDETGKVVKAQGVPTSVTLLVTPPQAEVIFFSLNNGFFQMSLRNPVDGVKVPLDHYGSDNFDDWRNR